MAHPYWPLLDLRLSVAGLELRPMCEADQLPLAALLPDDVELDPAATRYPGLDEPTSHRIIGFQHYWRSYGCWSPQHWRLNFCVRDGAELIGVQELEATDFPQLRTVDSSSYLVPRARGRGIGKQMRRAVLALAFGPLHAQAAISSAWQGNLASLAVSRALGYQDNGESFQGGPEGVGTMVHLRLRRSDWLAASGADGVRITGFEECLPYFGLGAGSGAGFGAGFGAGPGLGAG